MKKEEVNLDTINTVVSVLNWIKTNRGKILGIITIIATLTGHGDTVADWLGGFGIDTTDVDVEAPVEPTTPVGNSEVDKAQDKAIAGLRSDIDKMETSLEKVYKDLGLEPPK